MLSAATDKVDRFSAYDLYAFGKTMQEALAILAEEFGERCFASYTFRYLQFVACLLLDGHNAPVEKNSPRLKERDNKRFVQDVALGYPTELFARHRIRTAAELKSRLDRYGREYSWNGETPELDPWTPDLVNSGVQNAAFTRRVAAVFQSSCYAQAQE